MWQTWLGHPCVKCYFQRPLYVTRCMTPKLCQTGLCYQSRSYLMFQRERERERTGNYRLLQKEMALKFLPQLKVLFGGGEVYLKNWIPDFPSWGLPWVSSRLSSPLVENNTGKSSEWQIQSTLVLHLSVFASRIYCFLKSYMVSK